MCLVKVKVKLENWKIGKLENWKIGKLENWKIGKLENWKIVWDMLSSFSKSSILTSRWGGASFLVLGRDFN
jgi:hypothetical protein